MSGTTLMLSSPHSIHVPVPRSLSGSESFLYLISSDLVRLLFSGCVKVLATDAEDSDECDSHAKARAELKDLEAVSFCTMPCSSNPSFIFLSSVRS